MKRLVLAAAVPFFLAGPAAASTLINRAWVSGQGVDQPGGGPIANPCRSFQYVHDSIIAPGGEIDVLNAAGYGPINITKALSVINDGAGTAGVQIAAGNAITVNVGGDDTVVLRGLNIDGLGTATVGVLVNDGNGTSGGKLQIDNCVFRHFTSRGIDVLGGGNSVDLSLTNSYFSDIGVNVDNAAAIQLTPPALSHVSIRNTVVSGNRQGIVFDDILGRSFLEIVDSIVSNNVGYGMNFSTYSGNSRVVVHDVATAIRFIGGNGDMRIDRSVLATNEVGIYAAGNVHTLGNNSLAGNSVPVANNPQIYHDAPQ